MGAVMDTWIPVIIAALTTLTALFQWLDKIKAKKVSDVLVQGVEMYDSDALKAIMRDLAESKDVGDALAKIVKKVTT